MPLLAARGDGTPHARAPAPSKRRVNRCPTCDMGDAAHALKRESRDCAAPPREMPLLQFCCTTGAQYRSRPHHNGPPRTPARP